MYQQNKEKQSVLLRNHISLINVNDASLLYLFNFCSWHHMVP